ncbi:hypothetical protein P5P81_06050 [Tritonibacter mobilis]|nr:hypothetical protein [Tritonibacter mobilis]
MQIRHPMRQEHKVDVLKRIALLQLLQKRARHRGKGRPIRRREPIGHIALAGAVIRLTVGAEKPRVEVFPIGVLIGGIRNRLFQAVETAAFDLLEVQTQRHAGTSAT